MKKSIRASTVRRVKRKKPGPKPTTGKGKLIAIRWQAPELAIIDEFASTNDLTRGDALREIVRRLRQFP